MKPFLLFSLLLVFSLPGRAASVAITQARPIEKLDADGRPCGVSMAAVGATFTLVRLDGDNLILKDAGGVQYLIAAQATDYTPTPVATAPETNAPAPAPAAPEKKTVAQTAPPAPAVPTATPTPAPVPVAKAAPVPSGPDAEKIKQINDALGFPLLADAQFWQDDAGEVARRLSWPLESKTATEESYRRYAKKGEVPALGASAYSLALYGKAGKPTYLSIIFANAGDFAQVDDPLNMVAIAKIKKDLAVAVKKDADSITAALTPLLGMPAVTLYGNSSSNRDEVHRWDWNGVAFLLNSHQGEYVSLKIIPSGVADHHGTVEVTDRSEMRDILAKRVVRRENGDVLVSELPMVDQGPKGYCVPATWERYLRYMDVPADLYVLAILGGSGVGGGTSFERMVAGVDGYVSAYHRRIETYQAPLDVPHVAKYIDQGLPLMWGCWVTKPVEVLANKNSHDRKTVTDWSAYSKNLATQDAALGTSFRAEDTDHNNGHMRLIIGYNAATGEIAISDSWGSAMAERWLYAPTAKRISQGDLTYLSW